MHSRTTKARRRLRDQSDRFRRWRSFGTFSHVSVLANPDERSDGTNLKAKELFFGSRLLIVCAQPLYLFWCVSWVGDEASSVGASGDGLVVLVVLAPSRRIRPCGSFHNHRGRAGPESPSHLFRGTRPGRTDGWLRPPACRDITCSFHH